MKLSKYFFKQFIPPFIFGCFLFMFVLIFDKLFDLIDLIFNKGVSILIVIRLFGLFIPTVLPLTIPMAMILASLVTFGRISEENELTAVRAAGVSLTKILWLPLLFAILISFLMIPFNTYAAPWSNRAFMGIYEKIVHSDPLINVEPKKFFSIKNIRIYANQVDSKTNSLKNILVYQLSDQGAPADRIFSRFGQLESNESEFVLKLYSGQLQRFDANSPKNLIHTTFNRYDINIPLQLNEEFKSTRYRNIPNNELKKMILDLKKQGFSTYGLQAEYSLRYAMAFAPFCLVLMGIPLATSLKKGGRSVGFGISIVVIFIYYLFLILGLTLAEKGKLPSHFSLWIGNIICLLIGTKLMRKLVRT